MNATERAMHAVRFNWWIAGIQKILSGEWA